MSNRKKTGWHRIHKIRGEPEELDVKTANEVMRKSSEYTAGAAARMAADRRREEIAFRRSLKEVWE